MFCGDDTYIHLSHTDSDVRINENISSCSDDDNSDNEGGIVMFIT